MRVIFLILVILISVFIISFAQFNDLTLNLSLMYTKIIFRSSFLTVTLTTFALGILTGILVMLRGFFEGAKQTKKIKRQLEKVSIGADDSDLRVKTLENKIETLETALKKALEDK